VGCRQDGNYLFVPRGDVQYMDVSPKQILSISAALIPFIENDDANRALMGSNMQRQAVPLLKPEAPMVGTGVEQVVARDAGVVVYAKRGGIVEQIDASCIVVRSDEEDGEDSVVDIYPLEKFVRSNAGACINQRPLVSFGDRVKRGDVLADGPSTQFGELALGRNYVVAFMSWRGYNFEDAIIISEDAALRRDSATSIHIEELEVSARDTKLGSEEITRDIPGLGDESLMHLDESGIIQIGTEVSPGDILVGRVSPKAESNLMPEERLLKAIFIEKASDVKDTSLRVPPGVSGVVVDVQIFSRRGVEKDERTLLIEREEVNRIVKEAEIERSIREKGIGRTLREWLDGKTVVEDGCGFKAGETLTIAQLENIPWRRYLQLSVQDDLQEKIADLSRRHEEMLGRLQGRMEESIEKVQYGDDLSAGVLKTVKVFIATRRKIQPGDKMAGRHGNKGVVSIVVPVEDMPYLEDGTPVDIILNPLGLPSRMNVGQILEAHLGLAAWGIGRKVKSMLEEVVAQDSLDGIETIRSYLEDLYEGQHNIEHIRSMDDEQVCRLASDIATHGLHFASPAFEGPASDKIGQWLTKAGFDSSGQVTLYDGQTGEPFDRKITLGIKYMLKLHHLVDEKIHARSVGPYGLVTQQPLGGKALFGGQRLGEMEVWALEAYGAANILQEMLTIKSDDIVGRTKAYEAIVRGEEHFATGVPESFYVLIRELQALGLNVEFLRDLEVGGALEGEVLERAEDSQVVGG
jgi:DNA-directed RNA polymerase subunit beta